MKSFKEYINESMLTEASVKRLQKHLEMGEPVAIVSAYRSDYDDNKMRNATMCNKKTNELRSIVLSNKFGFNRGVGGFVEHLKDGSTREVKDERSTIIFAKPEREQELKKLAIALGKRFEQESILFVDAKGKACWIDTKNSVGKETPLGAFHPERVGDYFTKIKKQYFSFDVQEEVEYFSECDDMPMPSTIQMQYMDRCFKDLADKDLDETIEIIGNF